MLEVTKSTYFPAFNRLCKEVAQARMEANDNIVYLEPMVWHQRRRRSLHFQHWACPEDLNLLWLPSDVAIVRIMLGWKLSRSVIV